jgi:hypothetical protein
MLTNRLNEMESLLKMATASTIQQTETPDGAMLLDEPSVLGFGAQVRIQPALPQLPKQLSDPASISFETLLSRRFRERPGDFGELRTCKEVSSVLLPAHDLRNFSLFVWIVALINSQAKPLVKPEI